jgi:putative transposase
MFTTFSRFFSILQGFRTRAALQTEILALRHQLLVLERSSRGRQLRLSDADRLLWVWFSRLWSGWRSALMIVKPETVIAWHLCFAKIRSSGRNLRNGLSHLSSKCTSQLV